MITKKNRRNHGCSCTMMDLAARCGVVIHMETMETMPFEEDRNALFAKLAETAARANLTEEEMAKL